MKASSVHDIKKELESTSKPDLLSYCLRLAKFKKENKELLAFLLFESDDLPGYAEKVREQTSALFAEMNFTNVYYIKKSVRKILRLVNKHIRFTQSRLVEAELLIHFIHCFDSAPIPKSKSRQLINLYEGQVKKMEEALSTLHPDLQYDLRKQLRK
jgi:hypothetical protein